MSKSGRGHVSGPLASCAEGFRQELLDHGYTWGSAAKQVHLVAHLSHWLADSLLEPEDLSADVITQFLEARRVEGYTKLLSPRATEPLLGYLRVVGVVAPEQPSAPLTCIETVLTRYETYLTRERGLAAASIRSYVGVARRFLDDASIGEHVEIEGVSAAAVIAFVQRECGRRSVGSAKATVTGMRSLLRFLYLDARTPTLLAAAVPSVALWQLAALPKAVSATELARLFKSCDRRCAIGRRDFAILTVLARLGLRVGEVAALELGDIDWRGGEIAVRGKGGHADRLPLPVDVGEAVVGWLRRGRPRGAACSAVFVRLRAPHGPRSSSGASAVVRRACRRAGVSPFGAHRLRHTAATQMLRAGGTLIEVGQILRHARLHTTAVYAKVDELALSALAQPWPEP